MLSSTTILLLCNIILVRTIEASNQLRGTRLSIADAAECTLDVQIGCTVHSDGTSEQDCASFVVPSPTMQDCDHTPLTTTMLYIGGSCAQSDNMQFLDFDCRDGSTSPPIQDGEVSYIVVTDAMGKGIVYHEDWVAVGMEYLLDAHGGLLKDGILIEVYESDNRSHLLQKVTYANSLCSSNLEMLTRFGASQLISYYNQEQGIISPFASVSYTVTLHLSVTVPEDANVHSTSLQRLSLLTSFGGNIILDHLVRGTQALAGIPVTISTPVEIDMTQRQTHSILSQVYASGGCGGIQFHELHTGGI